MPNPNPITIKAKTCRSCKTHFVPARPLQQVCSVACSMAAARKKGAKAAALVLKGQRKALTEGRKALKSRSEWAKEAKVAIQQSRRLEELYKGRGCMSCGRSQAEVVGSDGWKPGGFWDGGHYLSKGAHIELALEPLNIWLQCKSCNSGSYYHAKKGHSVHEGYRANLIESEGLELVKWLESKHESPHHSIEELKAIKALHNAISVKLKALADYKL